MSGRFLLDTSILIPILRGDHSLPGPDSGIEVLLPAVAVGELYVGALKSENLANLKQIDGLLATCQVLSCDADTARHYGLLKDSLRRLGKPIPDNDLWIAAIASQHGLPVVTRDAHFGVLEQLQVVRW